MLLVRTLRLLTSRLDDASLERQLGPFVLVERPFEVQGKGIPQATQPLDRLVRGAAVDEFDELEVVTLPPVSQGDRFVVGRSPDCEVVLDEATVSGRHALLEWDGAAAWLTDLGSSNGTWVNGARLPGRMRLADRDALDFGRAKVHFLLVGTLRERLRRGNRQLGNLPIR
jgi:hypothetical protein